VLSIYFFFFLWKGLNELDFMFSQRPTDENYTLVYGGGGSRENDAVDTTICVGFCGNPGTGS